MWQLSRPAPQHIRKFLDAQRPLPFTYPFIGATHDGGSPPSGYHRNRHRQQLGTGEAAFAAARDAIRAWRMFPPELATIEPAGIPIAAGEVVAIVAHVFGAWILNAARIVYVIDEPRRFGFGYGTLPGHAVSGEERFLVERLADSTVWYDLDAFSRPHHVAMRLAFPLIRGQQRRFARLSAVAMVAAVHGH